MMRQKKVISRLGALLLTCALLLNGCTGKTGDASNKRITAENVQSDETYLISKHEIGGVPFYDVVRRDIEGKRPMVFFFHGLGGTKEEVLSYTKTLADEGYMAVAADAAGHGGNVREESLDFFQMIQNTALESGQILDFYKNSEYGDTEQFSMAGMSMGAMTALYYGAYSESRPVCIVSICGTPDWTDLLGTDKVYVKSVKGALQPISDEEEKKKLVMELGQNSPDLNMEALLSLPILMINGDADETVPVYGVQAFEAKASLFPNELTVSVKEGHKHDIEEGDVEEALDFLKEHMPAGDGESR